MKEPEYQLIPADGLDAQVQHAVERGRRPGPAAEGIVKATSPGSLLRPATQAPLRPVNSKEYPTTRRPKGMA